MNKINKNIEIAETDLRKVEEFRKRQNTSVLVVLFSDLQDSTRLREELGDIEFTKILKEHDSKMLPLIKKFNGEYIKSVGDGVLAVFSEPSSAVRFGLKVQEEFHRHRDLKVKIGMDMGQVSMEEADGISKDVFGRFVNRAARVVNLAEGGHVLVTDSIQDSASGWIEKTSMSWEDHSTQKVKGVDKPLRIWEPYNANLSMPQKELNAPDFNHPKKAEKRKKSRDYPVVRYLAVTAGVIIILLVFLVFLSTLGKARQKRKNLKNPVVSSPAETEELTKDNYSSDILEASKTGDYEKMKELLAKGAQVNIRAEDEEGNTPLFNAIERNDLQMVKSLLAHGADVNLTDRKNNTPLLLAVSEGNSQLASLLIEKGADVNKGNNENNNPLLLASYLGHIKIVRALLAKGAKTDQRDSEGHVALTSAARAGNIKIVKLLLDHGANINILDFEGNGLIHHAIFNDDIHSLIFLLDKGADIELKNTDGHSPLFLAFTKENEKAIKTLLNRGANINTQDMLGNTILHYVVMNENPETIKLLRKLGADPRIKNKQGKNSIELAEEKKNSKILEILKKR